MGGKFDTEDLSKFMVAVRQMLSVSTEEKIIFCSHNIQEIELAVYAKIRWWNEWVQIFHISNNGVETIIYIAKLSKQTSIAKTFLKNSSDMEGCNV